MPSYLLFFGTDFKIYNCSREKKFQHIHISYSGRLEQNVSAVKYQNIIEFLTSSQLPN